ncbi:MAG: cyclase, partial [Candidatus Dormibacteria bacterium]
DAEIVQQVPDRRIAWKSVSGAPNGGDIEFEPIDSQKTKILAHMEYEPEGLAETVGDKLGFVSRRVEGDLERFKKFVEERDVETGAWRGQV